MNADVNSVDFSGASFVQMTPEQSLENVDSMEKYLFQIVFCLMITSPGSHLMVHSSVNLNS